MTTLFKWRLRCLTDDKFEFLWSETRPTTCPNDKNHDINNDLTCIIDRMEPNIMRIKEENIETGGNFKCETKILTIPPLTINHSDFTYKIPVCLFAVYFVSTDQHEGDILEVDLSPNTLIGTISESIKKGETLLTVSQSVIDNIMLGYNITISDNKKTNNLGKILFIDQEKNQITVENACTDDFFIEEHPLLYLTIKIVENYEIGPPTSHIIGDSKIGGMYIPSDTIMRLNYENKSKDVTKKIIFKIEYTY